MPIDRSSLTNPKAAFNLIFKKQSTADIYQNNNIFQVRALTPSYSQPDESDRPGISILRGLFGGSPMKQYFVGRILGANSPHSFLPDPCDELTKGNSDADESEEVKKLVALHTTFLLPAEETANVGDFFEVSLKGGTNGSPFNLQFGTALRKLGDAPSPNPDEGCQSTLVDAFGEATPTTPGSISGGVGGSPVSYEGGTPIDPDLEKSLEQMHCDCKSGSGFENGNKLRCYLGELSRVTGIGVDIRDLDAIADITNETAYGFATVFTQIALLGTISRLIITAGNDAYHYNNCKHTTPPCNYSRHGSGKAIDFVITPASPQRAWDKGRTGAYGNDPNILAVGQIMSQYALGSNLVRYIDEYNYPSGYATGAHFHLTFGVQPTAEIGAWESGTAASNTAAWEAQGMEALPLDPDIITNCEKGPADRESQRLAVAKWEEEREKIKRRNAAHTPGEHTQEEDKA